MLFKLFKTGMNKHWTCIIYFIKARLLKLKLLLLMRSNHSASSLSMLYQCKWPSRTELPSRLSQVNAPFHRAQSYSISAVTWEIFFSYKDLNHVEILLLPVYNILYNFNVIYFIKLSLLIFLALKLTMFN